MNHRAELLEAALDTLAEGVAIVDAASGRVLWNRAAAALTGYSAEEIAACGQPPALYAAVAEAVTATHAVAAAAHASAAGHASAAAHAAPLLTPDPAADLAAESSSRSTPDARERVLLHHRLGGSRRALLRRSPLLACDGRLLGEMLCFQPAEEPAPALQPADAPGRHDRAALCAYLEALLRRARLQDAPFGVLWMSVDQASGLRRSHGADACEAMLRTVRQQLNRHALPGEAIGRWDEDDLLIVVPAIPAVPAQPAACAGLLAERARAFAELAAAASFRWWGDAIPLSVSVGAAESSSATDLASLLAAARTSLHAGPVQAGPVAAHR